MNGFCCTIWQINAHVYASLEKAISEKLIKAPNAPLVCHIVCVRACEKEGHCALSASVFELLLWQHGKGR